MDQQLQRFFVEMEHTLIRPGTMGGQPLTASTAQGTEYEMELAGEMRSLRDAMGDVAEDMAAAYGERPGSRTALGPG